MKRTVSKNLLRMGIALLAVFSACDVWDRPSEKIALSVGTRKITAEDLRALYKRMGLELDGAGEEHFDSFIERAVDHYLILEYGKQQGISLQDNELENAAREIKRDYAEQDFKDLLLKGAMDYGEWKEGLREQLLIRKITRKAAEAGPRVSIEEMKAYYDSHPEEFRRPAMIKFRQIVTKTRDEADHLQKRLAQGGSMAASVAESAKVPVSAGSYEPGWFAKGDLDESIEKVVFSLPVGKLSGVVESPYGFHIFEVLGRKPEGTRSFHEAMTEIDAKLHSERREAFYSEWIQNLRKTIPVTIAPGLLKELDLG